MTLDAHLIGALHLEGVRRGTAPAPAEHGLLQASTIAALLDGNYEGDVSFAELRGKGEIGLGTFDALDGEMIALDGEFFRADGTGTVHPVEPERRTPFAVLARFAPAHRLRLDEPTGQAALLASIDREVGELDQAHALRIDGHFEHVHARSVPAQTRPYRPLAEVMEDQRVFDFHDLDGTVVGFRFPGYAKALNVPGYHLHFISADRRRGGHVLDLSAAGVSVLVDDSTDIEVELPPGVSLDPDASASDDALRRVEHEG